MKDAITFLVGLFEDIKLPARRLILILALFSLLLGFFGFERFSQAYTIKKLEAKVSLLKELNALANDEIGKDAELAPIYEDVRSEVEAFKIDASVFPAADADGKTYNGGKFLSGSILWVVAAVFYIYIEAEKKKPFASYLKVILALLLLGVLFGLIGMAFPTLVFPWVNYFLNPILQVVLAVWVYKKWLADKPASPPEAAKPAEVVRK